MNVWVFIFWLHYIWCTYRKRKQKVKKISKSSLKNLLDFIKQPLKNSIQYLLGSCHNTHLFRNKQRCKLIWRLSKQQWILQLPGTTIYHWRRSLLFGNNSTDHNSNLYICMLVHYKHWNREISSIRNT